MRHDKHVGGRTVVTDGVEQRKAADSADFDKGVEQGDA